MSGDRPPEADDPELERYLAELRYVAHAPHKLGLALAMSGLAAAGVRAAWWHAMPRALPVVLIALALGLMAIGIVRRTRYHIRRSRDAR